MAQTTRLMVILYFLAYLYIANAELANNLKKITLGQLQLNQFLRPIFNCDNDNACLLVDY